MHPYDVAAFVFITVGGFIATAATVLGYRAADGLTALGDANGATPEERAARQRAEESLVQSQRRNEVVRRRVIAAGLLLVALGVIAFISARTTEMPASV